MMATVFLFLGCKKDEPVAKIPYDLTIEGGISTYTTWQFIRLTKPATLDQDNVTPVSNATVSINDGQNDIPFKEISSTGIYSGEVVQNKNFFKGYTLTVIYNNKKYMATDTLQPVLPIDASYVPAVVTSRNGGYRLTIPKHTFSTSVAQKWLILVQGKTWTENKFDESFPFSYSHVFGTPNALHPLTQEARVLDLGINDSVNIYKFSLSEAYSTYLYNLFQETDWKGLLSSVPGDVKGNISGNASGFFYATDVEMQQRTLKTLAGN
ncbi:DUF4249 family protein [Pedobacter sp. SG908]|uniref:DUF4249 family protein n=1 Tax=Pedobacter sp. SG908 TaxID=2587135 RepID=UPI0014246D80|nr:DUF4249 family protein [Pedobacter sp. SG908]NII83219.1 hypothetical protein [Pedobacter sp. SG908]